MGAARERVGGLADHLPGGRGEDGKAADTIDLRDAPGARPARTPHRR
jgi:hypothetical protein